MLPFALDQMIRASAEQLSAAVHWFFWGFNNGVLLKDVLECVPIPDQLQYLDILLMIFLTLATLCLSTVLIMDCLYHKWLDTNNKTGNPIKLIFQVLNYARKNKCPRLRSALMRNTLHVWTLESTSLEDHSQKKRWRMSRQSFVLYQFYCQYRGCSFSVNANLVKFLFVQKTVVPFLNIMLLVPQSLF